MAFIWDPGSGNRANWHQAGIKRTSCFLNMVLRDEGILSTKSKRTFEALLFLDSVSCQSNVQK